MYTVFTFDPECLHGTHALLLPQELPEKILDMKNILHKQAETAFYAFAFICIISCSQGTSRQDTDRVFVLLDSVETLSGRSLNSQALPLLDSALIYSEGNDTLRAYIYAEKANNLLTMGRMSEALPLSQRAIALGEKLGNNEILVNQYSAIGIVYRRLNLPDSAMCAYRKGIDVALKVNAMDYVANLYNNISVMFIEQDRYNEGLEYANIATKWAQEAKDSVELYSALATKSAALFRIKRYSESVAAVATEFPNILALGYVPLTLKCTSPMLRSLVELELIDSALDYMRQIQPSLQMADQASNGVIGIMEIQAAILHLRKEYRKELAIWDHLDTLVQTNGGIPRERILFFKG